MVRSMPIRRSLQCHPNTPCGALTGLEVEVARAGARKGGRRIALRFVAKGNVDALRLPHYVSSRKRADELWRHTCFEAFVRVGGGAPYHEFNLAPSGEWNGYRFDDYRHNMTADRYLDPPGIGTYLRREPLDPQRRDGLAAAGSDTLDRFETPFFSLTATLDLERTLLPLDEPWHLGLSAVIEERNGTISYWALSHPPGDPDFHHPDCFALELAPARPS